MAKLKIGFVGAGFVAHFHARAIQQVRGLNISGVTSRTRESAAAFAKMAQDNGLGDCLIYDSVSQMAPHVDAIAIYSPNFTRVAIMEEIAAAVKAGAALKGVICEKPLARNVAEARRLVDLADEAGLRTAYFENQIFMKPIKTQLAQLAPQQKTMGPLVLTRSAEEHGGPHEPWFWDPTRQGGGVLSDMGCHSIAVGWYALTPIGKSPTFLEPVAITADCALLKWGQPAWREKLLNEQGVDYSQTPAEDFATGMVTFRNPETGQLVKAQFTDSWMFENRACASSWTAWGLATPLKSTPCAPPWKSSSVMPPPKPSPMPKPPWKKPPPRVACWPSNTTNQTYTATPTKTKTPCAPSWPAKTPSSTGNTAWKS